MTGPGFSSNIPSINHNAHVLVELAGYLEAGRPDTELATQAKAPRSHHEIGDLVEKFTSFAFDQYQDAVALLGILATKLKDTGQQHVEVDAANQQLMDSFLLTTTLVPPEER